MTLKILLTGDVNLMNVTDPVVPFAKVAAEFKSADLVFSNLECCFYEPDAGHALDREGFFAPLASADALKIAGIGAVGLANNVNYGTAPILSSIARLDQLGIPHTGAGATLQKAREPVILERQGLRIGMMQRTSVFWTTDHEAADNAVGVATIRGHTAYQVPMFRAGPSAIPLNRPGVPPAIITWADPPSLKRFRDDVAALKAKCDIVIASCHWGMDQAVLEYMQEIAQTAIDAGADVVFGHGPHYSLPVESYRGKPIYYGLGSFSFHTGHGGVKHGDWVGMLAKVIFDGTAVKEAKFQFARHNDSNETVLCPLKNEGEVLGLVTAGTAKLGSKLAPQGDEVAIALV
ncbi:MAG TPA: CapA family protein [Xanthobacteraceae bacterium]|jgi:poly-gamma-glutamate synthesis protein (capsule biosynthesis protein)|nr:CapA family protein [Xanthobacteraceae bacterium]